MPELSQAIVNLRREWGLDFARVRGVLAGLAGEATLSQLVAASGLPRREVESVLHALAPFTKTDGDRYHVPDLGTLDRRSFVADVGDRGTPVSVGGADLEVRMTELAAGLPPARWRLDHVPATPETMARRALHLAGEYELDGASVLCLGDHDLTSLAVGSVVPEAGLTVVDIDERILDHVADSARRLCFPVTTAWADLRLALPPSLVGTADLAFTDPPYTTGGMRLFLMRALEALRPTGHERLAFCFGTGESHLVKALEVQALLGDLRLALEAMLPGFNHYDGAEAIGSRSDLYICRPTKGAKVGEPASTRSARSRRSTRAKAPGARIYTRGPAAEEAPAHALPEPIRTAALAAAGEGPLLVGDGWDDEAVELPEFFQRVAIWATAARPGPFPFSGTPVINTHPDHGGAALRTLLLAAPERAMLIVPRRDLPDPDLLAAAYDIATVPAGPGGDPAVVAATRHDRPPAGAAEAVLRHILLHPGAKVVNAWRDGLLAVARDAGRPLTKNEARALIAADSLPPTLRRLRTWELPLSALGTLVTEIARTAALP
jgi:branched-chain polyamine synthase A-like protein